MKEIVIKCGRVFDVFCKISLFIGGFGLVLMSAFILWQVFGRFVLNNTPTWTEPTALLLMLYFSLFVGAVGVREGFHLGLDLLYYFIPQRFGKYLELVVYAVLCFLGFAMMIYGLELARGTWNERIPAIFLPEGVRFLPMFFGGFLIGIFAIERALRLLLGIDAAKTAWDVEED